MAKVAYRVADVHGMQVVHDGAVYRPGDTFEADSREARKWARNGLVVPVDGSDPRADTTDGGKTIVSVTEDDWRNPEATAAKVKAAERRHSAGKTPRAR